MKIVNLLGMFRVGTNYTRALLELNYDVEVSYDSLGWKHGLIPTYTRDSPLSYGDSRPLVIVKNPHATMDSWYSYVTKNGKNFRANKDSLSEFIRSNVTFMDEHSPVSPEYYFSSPVEMWNSVTWNHVSFADSTGGLVVRYEDLVSDPEVACEQIAEHYGLERVTSHFRVPENVTLNMGDRMKERGSDPGRYQTGAKFSKRSYFLDAEYLKKFSREDIVFIRRNAVPSLLSRFDYSPVGSVKRGESDDYVIYTMASDGRLDDLTVLLESNSEFDAAPVRVIPFDGVSPELEEICRAYGAEIVVPDEKWDKLGQTLYRDIEYRPGVPSWRYFRKLNALDHQSACSTPFVFIDANVAIVNTLKPLVGSLHEYDVVFGSRSRFRRNFKPWAVNVLSHISPDIGEGFNAGFWMVRPGGIDPESIARLVHLPNTSSMLTRSPEQSVLSLSLALQGARVGLLADAFPDGANMISAEGCEPGELRFSPEGATRRGKKVLVVKWTGREEDRVDERPLDEVYQYFKGRAAERLAQKAIS